MSNTIQSEDLSKYKSADACLDLKIQHDKCFHKWMREKFLNGTATQDDCLPVWSLYESCIKKKLSAYNLSEYKRSEGDKPTIDVFELDLSKDTKQ